MHSDLTHHQPRPDDRESAEPRECDSSNDRAETLVPPRHWWSKRIGVVFGAVIILFSILHVWVEFRSRALLESRIRQWKAAGQPAEPQDFNRKTTLPDKQNAIYLYQKAAGLFTWPADVDSTLNLNDVEEVDRYPDEARKVVAINQPLLDLMRQASMLEEGDWGVRVTSPMIGLTLPSLSDTRQCCRITCLASAVAAREGHDAESVRLLRDVVHVGAVLTRTAKTLLETYLSNASYGLAARWIEKNLEHIGRADSRENAMGELQVEFRLLIDEFLDEKALSETFRRGMFFERACFLDMAQQLGEGTINPASLTGRPPAVAAAPIHHVWRWIARPLWRRDAVRCADRITGLLAADFSRPFDQTAALVPKPVEKESRLNSAISPIGSYLTIDLTRPIELFYQSIAQRRMAAMAVAIRWFEIENGHRPKRLSELVPKYLPLVPIDPFDPDGEEIRYLPDAAPAILYSVGLNQIDEGGDSERLTHGRIRWRVKDLVFRLDPEPKSPESEN